MNQVPNPVTLDSGVRRSEAIARVFLKHAPSQVAAIGAALGDAAELKRAAHRLKGSCLAVGVPRMASLCAELEAGCSDPEALYARLGRELVRVCERLEASLPARGR